MHRGRGKGLKLGGFYYIHIPHIDECVYLQEGRLHGWVVDSTQGRWGRRGRKAWNPRERQQSREAATSWRLKPTAQPRTHKHSNSRNMRSIVYRHILIALTLLLSLGQQKGLKLQNTYVLYALNLMESDFEHVTT